LLITNALLILNRRRFLAKYGLDDVNSTSQWNQNNLPAALAPLRVQAIGLLQAVQYLKVPVIACNIVVIIVEIIIGG
jgi:Yos1-like